MFSRIGATELIVILVIVLLLFGARKLPELARGFGQSIREFRDAQRDGEKEEKDTDASVRKG